MPLTAKSVTFKLVVADVAVTVPVLVDAPVENPVANVPEYLPKLAAMGFAKVIAEEVVPPAMLPNAEATSAAVMFTLAVKVRPFIVTNSFEFKDLN
jgi:hypothetical protein